MLVSSSAAAMSDDFAAAARSRPASATVRPPIRCLREVVGREGAQPLAHRLDEGRADGVRRAHDVDEPEASGVVRGEGLGEQLLEIEHLHAARAHRGHELVVLPLGALDPEDIVEEELVVVGRGQPAKAEVGSMDDDPPQLPDFRVDAEGAHLHASWVREMRVRP